MSGLVDILGDPERRRAIVADGVVLIEEEVGSKRGLRGAALKTGFRGFKKVKPGITATALDKLLPHFLPVLDPYWEQARTKPDPAAWLAGRDSELADALLGVTDRLAETAKSRVLLGIYRSLRGSARGHVVAAIPRFARVMVKHAA